MKTNILLIVLSINLFTNCTEKIDIKLDESASKIVIEGSISTEQKSHTIKVSKSAGYFYNKPAQGVSGATVTISDGEQSVLLTETSQGIYQTPSDFAGKTGRTYKLIVHYNAVDYTATSTLNAVSPLDSIALEKATIPIEPGAVMDPKKTYYNIKIYCQEPGGIKNYYMMDAFRNGVNVTDTITKKGIANDDLVDGSYINGMNALQVVADKGDSLSLQLASIDEGYYLYVLAIREALSNGNPFSGAPANVKGNISNGAFGYFYATAFTKKTKVIK